MAKDDKQSNKQNGISEKVTQLRSLEKMAEDQVNSEHEKKEAQVAAPDVNTRPLKNRWQLAFEIEQALKELAIVDQLLLYMIINNAYADVKGLAVSWTPAFAERTVAEPVSQEAAAVPE